MLDTAKTRIITAVDELVADGITPDRLMLHPKTAARYAIHATHVDLNAFHDRERIAAELTHPTYDADPNRADKPEGRPLDPKVAAKLAAERCQAHLRRPYVLEVVLDAKIEEDKFLIDGSKRHGKAG